MRALAAAGFRPDYVSVRRASDLAGPSRTDRDLVVLAAAYLGKARLLDNIRVISAAPASEPKSNDRGSPDK
jgi:pantoate--beta-alanine ligase